MYIHYITLSPSIQPCIGITPRVRSFGEARQCVSVTCRWMVCHHCRGDNDCFTIVITVGLSISIDEVECHVSRSVPIETKRVTASSSQISILYCTRLAVSMIIIPLHSWRPRRRRENRRGAVTFILHGIVFVILV